MEESSDIDDLNENDPIPTADKDDYEILSDFANGKFAYLFKAIHKNPSIEDQPSQFFVIKKNLHASLAENEIDVLKRLSGVENVVKMMDVLLESPKVYSIVLELCKEDFFYILIVRKIIIKEPEIKLILQQFFTGLNALHSKGIMHRDIKSANLLLSHNGVVKICDFGSAMQDQPPDDLRAESFNNDVGARWYKAPELLLGDKNYCNKIDLWAAGCVAFELWANQILFKGNTDRLQLISITQTCGFIGEGVWSDVVTLTGYREGYLCWAKKYLVSHLHGKLDTFTSSHEDGVDLMLNLLRLNPYDRTSAEILLTHKFFCDPDSPPANNLNKLLRRLDKAPREVEVPAYLQDGCSCRSQKEDENEDTLNQKKELVDDGTQTDIEE